jgi:hypothetical protein
MAAPLWIEYLGNRYGRISPIGRALLAGDLAAADRMIARSILDLEVSLICRDRAYAHTWLACHANNRGNSWSWG